MRRVAIIRDRRVHMVMSQDEWAMLCALAERMGVTISDWMRLRIREAHGEGPALQVNTTK